jgi:predicted transcriptional regulator
MTDLEDRIEVLERRVSDLESQLGYLIPQLKQAHADLLHFREETGDHLAENGEKIDAVHERLDEFPDMIGSVLQDVLEKGE